MLSAPVRANQFRNALAHIPKQIMHVTERLGDLWRIGHCRFRVCIVLETGLEIMSPDAPSPMAGDNTECWGHSGAALVRRSGPWAFYIKFTSLVWGGGGRSPEHRLVRGHRNPSRWKHSEPNILASTQRAHANLSTGTLHVLVRMLTNQRL